MRSKCILNATATNSLQYLVLLGRMWHAYCIGSTSKETNTCLCFCLSVVVHLRHPHTYTHTKANNCLKNENEFSDLHIYLPFCCIILLKLFRKSDPRMEFSTQSASGYQCEWVTVLPLSGKKLCWNGSKRSLPGILTAWKYHKKIFKAHRVNIWITSNLIKQMHKVLLL